VPGLLRAGLSIGPVDYDPRRRIVIELLTNAVYQLIVESHESTS
jgi:hypothetical protein